MHNYFKSLDQFYRKVRGTAMGLILSRYTPISPWATGRRSTSGPTTPLPNIVFFVRYIDDMLLIWGGGPYVFYFFVAHCNANSLGLFFTYVIDPGEIVFLDLVLSHEGDTIINKNHTKPTCGNSCLHYSSCHHSAWKWNIPGR